MRTIRNAVFFLFTIFAVSNCFFDVDINTDVHDNPVTVGDACDLLRDKFGKKTSTVPETEPTYCQGCTPGPEPDTSSSSVSSSAASSSSGSGDPDAGTPEPKAVGETCAEDNECQSDFCLCEICIDPAELL